MKMMNVEETRFSKKLESLFWWILRFVPLIGVLTCICLLLANGHAVNVTELAKGSFFVSEESIVYTTLMAVVGPEGVLPMLTEESAVVLLYLGYLVILEIARLFTSLFLFIIRYCIRMIEKFM